MSKPQANYPIDDLFRQGLENHQVAAPNKIWDAISNHLSKTEAAIDDLFKNSLENHHVTPPPALWAGIDQNLTNADATTDQLFQDNLGNYEVTPPPAIWVGIDQSLSNANATTDDLFQTGLNEHSITPPQHIWKDIEADLGATTSNTNQFDQTFVIGLGNHSVVPAPQMWDKIATQLSNEDAPKVIPFYRKKAVQVAAALLICLFSWQSYGLLLPSQNNTNTSLIATDSINKELPKQGTIPADLVINTAEQVVQNQIPIQTEAVREQNQVQKPAQLENKAQAQKFTTNANTPTVTDFNAQQTVWAKRNSQTIPQPQAILSKNQQNKTESVWATNSQNRYVIVDGQLRKMPNDFSTFVDSSNSENTTLSSDTKKGQSKDLGLSTGLDNKNLPPELNPLETKTTLLLQPLTIDRLLAESVQNELPQQPIDVPLTAYQASTKGLSLGFFYGFNNTRINSVETPVWLEDVENVQYKVGFGQAYGFNLNYDFTQHFGIQAEWMVKSNQGQRYIGTKVNEPLEESDLEVHLAYTHFPILLKYRWVRLSNINHQPVVLNVLGGIKYGNLRYAEVNINGVIVSDEVVQPHSWGYVFGMDYDWYLNNHYFLSLGARSSIATDSKQLNTLTFPTTNSTNNVLIGLRASLNYRF
ncbi:MAG: porin family protein [Chitinophagales bacterium]